MPRSLATTCGITVVFSSSSYLDVSVQRVRSSFRGTIYMVGCPIRISADYRLFAPPRGFSQLITSFFASESQGIPHAPFLHSVITDKSRNLAWYLFSPSTSFVENTGPFSPLLFSSLKSSLLFLFAIYVVSRISLSSPCPRLRFQSCQCPLLGWRSRGSSLSSPLCLRSPWQS